MVAAETVEDRLFLYVSSLFLELPQLQEMYVLQIVSGYRLLQSSNKMSCASILLGKCVRSMNRNPCCFAYFQNLSNVVVVGWEL